MISSKITVKLLEEILINSLFYAQDIKYYETDTIDSNRKNQKNKVIKKNRIPEIDKIDKIPFASIVLSYSIPTLKELIKMFKVNEDDIKFEETILEAKKSLYFWQSNPDNNEKHLRKEFKSKDSSNDNVDDNSDNEKRNYLGVANANEWIENFNIGSIMHISPITYEEFSFYGELIYELSKKMILETVN